MSFELYKIPQGKMTIVFSNKEVSVGTLELDPGQELSRHNRPVPESLFQLRGKSVIRFDLQEIRLEEGDSVDIEPERFHIHSNPFDETSVTLWKFEGDITEIINKIRESNRM